MSEMSVGCEPSFAYVPRKEIVLRIGLPPTPDASEPVPYENAFPINFTEVYNLKGRLFTLIDATYTDPEQRKAQKDIVWQALKGWMHDIEDCCGFTTPQNPVLR